MGKENLSKTKFSLTLFRAGYFYYVNGRGGAKIAPPWIKPKMVSNDFSRVFEHGHDFFRQNFDFWGLHVFYMQNLYLALESAILIFRQNKKNSSPNL